MDREKTEAESEQGELLRELVGLLQKVTEQQDRIVDELVHLQKLLSRE